MLNENADRTTDIINGNIYKFQMIVAENQEEFIFSTLSNWVHDNFQIRVNKQELIQAIEIVRACKHMGNYSLRDACVNAKSHTSFYNDGFKAGYKQGRESIRDLIDEELDNE
jgi:hypothetical protein